MNEKNNKGALLASFVVFASDLLFAEAKSLDVPTDTLAADWFESIRADLRSRQSSATESGSLLNMRSHSARSHKRQTPMGESLRDGAPHTRSRNGWANETIKSLLHANGGKMLRAELLRAIQVNYPEKTQEQITGAIWRGVNNDDKSYLTVDRDYVCLISQKAA